MGYILLRPSRYVRFLHFLYGEICADGRTRMVSYVPRFPKRSLLPPPLFDGKVKWGDR